MSEHATTTLAWSDALALGHASIDRDHQVFIRLLNQAITAEDRDLATAYADLMEHLREHFAYEEGLMATYGFFAIDCHAAEHQRVLGEMERINEDLRAGRLDRARAYVRYTLPDWFQGHHRTMDTVTTNFIRHSQK